MNYKRVALLAVLLIAAAGVFVFSSWTNAMVVSGEEIPKDIEALNKFSPLLAGFLAVICVGVLVTIVFDRK